MTAEELIERLAAIEHERWAGWQRWMHGRAVDCGNPVGLHLTKMDVDRWERQIATPYSELTEAEKESDREQVDRYWTLIEPMLRSAEWVEAAERVIEAAHKLVIAVRMHNAMMGDKRVAGHGPGRWPEERRLSAALASLDGENADGE